MREFVRESRYVMTAHGRQEMHADDLTVFDVEHCVLTGRIIERQRDRNRENGSIWSWATLSHAAPP